MTDSQFNLGLQERCWGIRLALVGQHFLRDGGSITLVSGIVAQEPIRGHATTVNAGLEGFVRAAACELPRGSASISSAPLQLSPPCSLAAYGDFFPGFPAFRRRRRRPIAAQH